MDSKPDIIVVGAGVVGCAVAYELARRGASVQVVDDRPVGGGATQASAGVLAPYIEAREAGPLLDLTVRALDLYDTFVGCAVAESGVDVLYRRTGSLDIALEPSGMSHLEAVARLLASMDVEALLLDARAVRGEETRLATGVAGGLLIPSHGFVAATDFTRALATAARRHGAQILERLHVKRVFRDGDELAVETGRGVLKGSRVVLAAGSWAGQIDIEGVSEHLPVRPIRGQLLQLAWHDEPLRRVVWGEHCYMVPWDDGTLLVGATMEDVGFDERTTVSGVKGLIDAACELVPQVSSCALTSARAGLRPALADHLPAIGDSQVLPGLTYATGHFRNGILLAPLTAQVVADLVLDGRIDPLLALTRPDRFGAL